jgi:hypothetical protein
MLSSRLVQLIEDHCESISTRFLNDFRQDTRLRHLAGLPRGELVERLRDVLLHLGHWLTSSSQLEIAERFERIGRRRCQEGIPAQEIVLAYCLIKERAIEFVRDQGIARSSLELYAEEELEHAVGRFFDAISYYMVRGYEEARGEALRAHA